jgi:hypothetical protein
MRAVVAGVLALALIGAACDDDDETTDALDTVCDAEQSVAENLSALLALDPATNTTGEYQEATEALESSIEDLGDARSELGDQNVDNVSQAYDDLQSQLSELDDVPLNEAGDETVAAVQAQAAELQELYQQAYADSSCTPDSTEE